MRIALRPNKYLQVTQKMIPLVLEMFGHLENLAPPQQGQQARRQAEAAAASARAAASAPPTPPPPPGQRWESASSFASACAAWDFAWESGICDILGAFEVA